MPDLTGKNALVTGGSRGIGAAIVRRLVADGASAAINYRSGKDTANDLATELVAPDRRVVALQADVTDPNSTQALVDPTVDALGGLDILVSNAGVEHFGPLESITPADYQRVFTTNVAGQLFATQAAAAAMGEAARIVLNSSVSARIAVFEPSPYAAGKAAVSALVLNLAPELATRGIAINAIAPGGTRTDMADEKDPSTPHPLCGTCHQDADRTVHRLGTADRTRRDRQRCRVPRLPRRLVHHRSDRRRRRLPALTAR